MSAVFQSDRMGLSPGGMLLRSPLALWHLLSLDAPTVAMLWTWFIAHCAGTHLSHASLASMFLAVWLLYAADRLLDARAIESTPYLNTQASLEARHHFHHRYRKTFLVAIVFVGLLLATLLPFLPAPALRLYVLLGALLIAWFLVIHARLATAERLPKELAVGIFFPAAIFIPTVAEQPDLRLALLTPALLLGSLCMLNCVFLYAWEHPAGSAGAHWTTRFALRHMRFNASAVLFAGFGIFCLLERRAHEARLAPLAAACCLSAGVLLWLDRNRTRLSAIHLRACADAALLTPVFWFLSKSHA